MKESNMLVRNIGRKLRLRFSQKSKMKNLEDQINSGLPKQMRSAIEYLLTEKFDKEIDTVVKRAEAKRKKIACQGNKKIPIWYSPKPGSAGNDSSIRARPKPGKILNFTMEKVAKTGKDKRWGTVLYLIARDFQSKTVFELGSCIGISAIYMSSSPSVEKLITVEGSKALARIAEENLKEYKCATVVNCLFDQAFDSVLPGIGQNIDFAYIDGHHEKVATIHYFNRLLPFLKKGAVVVFDDISWSYDMREAWDSISKRPEFSNAIDLGLIGVCIIKTASEKMPSEPKFWNLQTILGKIEIGEPHGWKE